MNELSREELEISVSVLADMVKGLDIQLKAVEADRDDYKSGADAEARRGNQLLFENSVLSAQIRSLNGNINIEELIKNSVIGKPEPLVSMEEFNALLGRDEPEHTLNQGIPETHEMSNGDKVAHRDDLRECTLSDGRKVYFNEFGELGDGDDKDWLEKAAAMIPLVEAKLGGPIDDKKGDK